MVRLSTAQFKCELLTPMGMVFQDRVGQVVLPAHDGMIGVLYNHAPMLCSLGMGIMRVTQIKDRPDAEFLIDGGLARVSENILTVLAYEVVDFENSDENFKEDLVRNAAELLAGQDYIRTQKKTGLSRDKARLILKLADFYHLNRLENKT